MRTPIMAGNWKMNKTPAEALSFSQALVGRLASWTGKVETVLIPPYVALYPVQGALGRSGLKLGAQDVHHEAKGAYTGAVAADMLVGLVEYVVIGHSETRQYLGVTDAQVNQKARALLAAGLKPIIAMGENLRQNQDGLTELVCQRQIRAAFADIPASALPNIVVAYEPIWAIGTGKNADADFAQRIIGGAIRGTLRELYGDDPAESVRIQYGGSMSPANAEDYLRQPDIDGGLIGGASLKEEDFSKLIEITIKAKGL